MPRCAPGGCSQPLLLFRGMPEPTVAAVEPTTTGSIARPSLTFGADLNGEDWRRAQGALSLALDPQGNGRPVKWDNPDFGDAWLGQPDRPALRRRGPDLPEFPRLGHRLGAQPLRARHRLQAPGGEWSLKRVHTAAAPARMPGEKGSEETGPAAKSTGPRAQAAAKADDEAAE